MKLYKFIFQTLQDETGTGREVEGVYKTSDGPAPWDLPDDLYIMLDITYILYVLYFC